MKPIINLAGIKEHLLLCLLLIITTHLCFAFGDPPRPKSKMNFEEYQAYVVTQSEQLFESYENFYRTLYLIFQVLAVILSSLIPILLNSLSDEKRKKTIITVLSIIVAISIGLTNVINFKQQSIVYGTATVKLRKNFMEYETGKGIYEKIKNDSTEKLNTYKYVSDIIISNAKMGLIESLPNSYVPTNQ